jgi:PmbA protein
MSLLQREEALAIARRLIDASEATETEVGIDLVAERFARFADSGPTQSADRERHMVAVRARVRASDGWCEGKAICDGLGEAETLGALERATALARVAPPDGQLAPLEGAYEGMDQFGGREPDAATLGHDFAAKAGWVRDALAACAEQDLVPAGLAITSGHVSCLVNSAGREVFDARSRAALSLTASAPGFDGGSGFAEAITARVGELDSEMVLRRAVEKAVCNREPRPIEAGEYTVVLEPDAVSSILLFAAYQGFGAQAVHEQASFLCGRVGEELFPQALSIDDDAQNEVYPGLAFDGEGAPKRRVELLRRGVLTGPVTDSDWARKLGIGNTGHAHPKPNTDGPSPRNLVVHAGDSSLQDLIGGVERGLLVTQFHYTNMIDPKDLLLTGMTRNGTFLIEGGEVVGAVKNLRFTESLVNALANVSGIGRDREVAGALFDGEIVTPALRIDGFRFTSTTDF